MEELGGNVYMIEFTARSLSNRTLLKDKRKRVAGGLREGYNEDTIPFECTYKLESLSGVYFGDGN